MTSPLSKNFDIVIKIIHIAGTDQISSLIPKFEKILPLFKNIQTQTHDWYSSNSSTQSFQQTCTNLAQLQRQKYSVFKLPYVQSSHWLDDPIDLLYNCCDYLYALIGCNPNTPSDFITKIYPQLCRNQKFKDILFSLNHPLLFSLYIHFSRSQHHFIIHDFYAQCLYDAIITQTFSIVGTIENPQRLEFSKLVLDRVIHQWYKENRKSLSVFSAKSPRETSEDKRLLQYVYEFLFNIIKSMKSIAQSHIKTLSLSNSQSDPQVHTILAQQAVISLGKLESQGSLQAS